MSVFRRGQKAESAQEDAEDASLRRRLQDLHELWSADREGKGCAVVQWQPDAKAFRVVLGGRKNLKYDVPSSVTDRAGRWMSLEQATYFCDQGQAALLVGGRLLARPAMGVNASQQPQAGTAAPCLMSAQEAYTLLGAVGGSLPLYAAFSHIVRAGAVRGRQTQAAATANTSKRQNTAISCGTTELDVPPLKRAKRDAGPAVGASVSNHGLNLQPWWRPDWAFLWTTAVPARNCDGPQHANPCVSIMEGYQGPPSPEPAMRCPQRTLSARWPRLHHWPGVESVACEGMAAAQPPGVFNTSSNVEVTPLWAAQQVVHGHQNLGVSAALGSMRACVVDAGAVSYLMVRHANVPTLFS